MSDLVDGVMDLFPGADRQALVCLEQLVRKRVAEERAAAGEERGGEAERLRAALTPNAETKAAYMGEFRFHIIQTYDDGKERVRSVQVPWPTVKEIMAAIRAYAGGERGGEGNTPLTRNIGPSMVSSSAGRHPNERRPDQG